MAVILDITTAVPPFSASTEELVNFYAHSLSALGVEPAVKKLTWLGNKTKINTRYSCIPDFNGKSAELFTNGNYKPGIEDRTTLYKAKALPLAIHVADTCFRQNKIKPNKITHIITVSCTGIFAPGLEFLLAEYFEMQHIEKVALNFLGCYAALKAIKHAEYIAHANPLSCILIVCVELCSLHFNPIGTDDEMISNLLFADGAAAVIVCGDDFGNVKTKTALRIDGIGSAYVPNTLDLMTWNISSESFRMHLSKHIVDAIKDNIAPAVNNFLVKSSSKPVYWAIHPGGVRIVAAVKESLGLTDGDVSDSLSVLRNYGNMSSPTILFILKEIQRKVKNDRDGVNKKIFACAFGPGINIEMINFSVVDIDSNRNFFPTESSTRDYDMPCISQSRETETLQRNKISR